jgi:hypothetical protein
MIRTGHCCAILSLSVAICMTAWAAARAHRLPPPPQTVEDYVKDNSNLTSEHKTEFSWNVFQRISQPIPKPHAQHNEVNLLWETWADNDTTFPEDPHPGSGDPSWQGASKQSAARKVLFKNPLNPIGILDGAKIEVRRNQAAFESIIRQKIWYTQGLDCAYKQGIDNSGILRATHLDKGSVEIKAAWAPLGNDDRNRFYVNKDSSGAWFKLVGLHIMTNALDTWTWSTFEQVDQLTCAPGGDCINLQKASLSKNPTPHKLVKTLNDTVPFWKNYRLVDTQISSTDPEYLGNSTLELGTSKTSCISCHAAARRRATHSNTDIFADPTDADNTTDHVSRHGRDLPPPFPDRNDPNGLYRPMGFLWSLIHTHRASDDAHAPPCNVP